MNQHDEWINNRLKSNDLISSFTTLQQKQEDKEESDEKIQLIINNIKPSFDINDDNINSFNTTTANKSIISVVKDKNSDFTKLAKKGSTLLHSLREQNTRSMFKDKFWQVAGTKIGNLIKLSQKNTSSSSNDNQTIRVIEEEEETITYKTKNQYAKHMKLNKLLITINLKMIKIYQFIQ